MGGMRLYVFGLAILIGFGAGMAAEKKKAPGAKKQAQYNPKELGVDKAAAKWELSELDASKNRTAQKKARKTKK